MSNFLKYQYLPMASWCIVMSLYSDVIITMAGRLRKSSKHWLFRKNAGKLTTITKTKFPSPVDTASRHEDHHLLLDSIGKSADIPSSSSSSSPPSPLPYYNLRPGS